VDENAVAIHLAHGDLLEAVNPMISLRYKFKTIMYIKSFL
jgi:hypothetical protein